MAHMAQPLPGSVKVSVSEYTLDYRDCGPKTTTLSKEKDTVQ